MMNSFWPTPMAEQFDPVMAKQMNELNKVVFSKTLKKATWNNTKLIKGDLVKAIKNMKSETGPDMVILGSGTIVSQLAEKELIDEIHLVVFPIVLGKGRTMFEDLTKAQNFKTTSCRTFRNGNILISYEKI